MHVIVLDQHPLLDARVVRHLKYLLAQGVTVSRIHFNFFNAHLTPGPFSEFGEQGFRINAPWGGILGKVYFNTMYLQPRLILPRLRRACASMHTDTRTVPVLHVHDPMLLSIAVLMKNTLFPGSPIIYDRHEIYENFPQGRIPRFYETVNRKHLSGLVLVSAAHIPAGERLFPGARIAVVQNFPSYEDYDISAIQTKIAGFQQGAPLRLVYVGSLEFNFDRDVVLLLKIADAVLSEHPDAEFFLGGSAYNSENELRRMLVPFQAKFPGRFHHLGIVSRGDTVRLTEQANVGFLLTRPTSDYWVRTSANKVYEYLICGVIPVIRADVDYADELTGCSLLFGRDSDEKDVVRSVRELLGDRVRSGEMMERAFVAGKKFRFDAVAGKYLDLYHAVQGGQSRPASGE